MRHRAQELGTAPDGDRKLERRFLIMPYSFTLSFGEDYPLSKNLYSFEAYQFVTTPKFIAEHPLLEKEGIEMALFRDGGICIDGGMTLKERKNMLTDANRLMKEHGIAPDSNGNKVGCFLCDFLCSEPEPGPEDPGFSEYCSILRNEIWYNLILAIADWTLPDRWAVMTGHFFQNDRPAHIHVLYDKKRGRKDELQNYLMEKLS